MILPPAAADLAVLQRAFGVLANDPGAAERLVRGLPDSARRHPDALFVLGMALRRQQLPAEARPLFEAALAAAPRHAQIWNAYGNLLDELGDAGAAIAALQKAAALDPRYAEAWINLGIVATAAAQPDVAADALAHAAALVPHDARLAAARGLLEQALGRPEAALIAYRAALGASPGDRATRHNLATVLRALDRHAAALVELDAALATGFSPETATVRAHVLAELGRFDDAVDQYRAVLRTHPEWLDAQDTLARLLPQIGRRDEALEGYTQALEGTASPALYQAAIAAAQAVGDAAQMLRWAEAALAAHGDHPDRALARVGALTLAGRRDAAIAAARALAAVYPGHAGVHVHLAHLLLQSGDAEAAEPHALAATRIDPDGQSAWALLTLIWRLTGDAREGWLAGYDRLVMPATLSPPPGWPGIDAFLGDLAATLTRLHVTTLHPADQSLRGGTQTRGNLFDRADPVIAALVHAVQAATTVQLQALPRDRSHPFLRRNTGRTTFAGSWSVRLRSEGFHVSHVHPSGWLSSALYIDVPPEIGAAGSGDAGKLLFGVPDAALGLDLPPRRIETPQPGKLVLFPSYFWHGTAPFESASPRLTVAFDAVPLG